MDSLTSINKAPFLCATVKCHSDFFAFFAVYFEVLSSKDCFTTSSTKFLLVGQETEDEVCFSVGLHWK